MSTGPQQQGGGDQQGGWGQQGGGSSQQGGWTQQDPGQQGGWTQQGTGQQGTGQQGTGQQGGWTQQPGWQPGPGGGGAWQGGHAQGGPPNGGWGQQGWQPPAPPPATSSSAGKTIAMTVVSMLLVAALAVGVLFATGILYTGDGGEASAGGTAQTPSSTASPTVDPTKLVWQDGQTFAVVPPQGWQTKTDATSTVANGAPMLVTAPDVDAFLGTPAEVAPGFSVVNLTGVMTADDYLTAAAASPIGDCPFGAKESFDRGGFSGSVIKVGPCPASSQYTAYDGQYWFVAGTRTSDGATIGGKLNVTTTGGVTDAYLATLDTYTTK